MQINNRSYDPSNLTTTLSISPQAPLPIGINNMTLTVSNGYRNSSCNSIVTIQAGGLLIAVIFITHNSSRIYAIDSPLILLAYGWAWQPPMQHPPCLSLVSTKFLLHLDLLCIVRLPNRPRLQCNVMMLSPGLVAVGLCTAS